jgi:hypothetical protein
MSQNTNATGESRGVLNRASGAINHAIDDLSNFLSKRRGLPMVVGLLCIILNFVIVLLNNFAQGGVPALGFLLRTDLLLHVELIVGFLGVLIAEPLGRN